MLWSFALQLSAMEISYSFTDTTNNKVVKNIDQDKPMVLASVSKLYTINYVLNNLDPNSKILTEVLIDTNSKIKDETLFGDLIIKPNGNPYLTAQNFLDLIYQIKESGIREVKGRFIVSTYGSWQTDRLSTLGLEDQADNPAMGPLNFEFNRFNVDKKTNSPIPPMSYLKVTRRKLNSPGLKYQLIKKNDNEEVWAKNLNEKHKKREALPTRNSTLFSAYSFQFLAKAHGLILPDPEELSTKEFSGPKMKVVATQESLTLSRLAELGLEYSNNLIAEMLLFQVSSKDPLHASLEMLSWYKNKYSKDEFSWDKTTLVNGSGLSLENQTTSKNLSLLLSHIYNSSKLKRKLITYLSINGHSGGIRRRLYKVDQSYRVYAKTGSLFFVNNLAGYLIAKSGKLYSFSIFTTDKKMREVLSKPNSKKVDKIRKKNKKWYVRSNQVIDNTISKFIQNN